MALRKQPPSHSKVEEIRHYLRNLAYELGPDAQLPSVRLLCEQLTTTRVTLKGALDLLEAEQVLYRKERKGIYVSPHIHHKSLHIVFDSNYFEELITPFWSILWIRLMQEAQERASLKRELCQFHLYPSLRREDDALPQEAVAMLRASRVDGLITIGFNVEHNPWLQEQSFPCVSFAGASKWIVEIDADEMVRLGTQALIERSCTKIAFWLPYPFDGGDAFRVEETKAYQLYRQLLEENHVPFYPELVRVFCPLPSQKLPALQEQGYYLAREVFNPYNPMKPDGLFICDDNMTDGALVALEKYSIQLGSELQLATHFTTSSTTLFGRTENMTLIEFDPSLLVKMLFSTLDMQMLGQYPPSQVTRLRPKLRYGSGLPQNVVR